MQHVTVKDNMIILDINPRFYDVETIKRTLELFSEDLEGQLEVNDRAHVTLKPRTQASEQVGYEFFNALLSRGR